MSGEGQMLSQVRHVQSDLSMLLLLKLVMQVAMAVVVVNCGLTTVLTVDRRVRLMSSSASAVAVHQSPAPVDGVAVRGGRVDPHPDTDHERLDAALIPSARDPEVAVLAPLRPPRVGAQLPRPPPTHTHTHVHVLRYDTRSYFNMCAQKLT